MPNPTGDRLSVSAVDARPRQVDWQHQLSDEPDAPGWSYYEAFEYEEDEADRTYTLIATGDSVTGVWLNDFLYTDSTGGDGDLDDETLGRLLEIEPWEHAAEGPMMNAFWPLEDSQIVPREAAAKISDLPLCVIVDDQDDVIGLALTGGGMDLSWEIAAAYVAIGYLPPLALLDLPRLAGPHEAWKLDVVDAYEQAIAWKRRGLTYNRQSLAHRRRDLVGVDMKSRKTGKQNRYHLGVETYNHPDVAGVRVVIESSEWGYNVWPVAPNGRRLECDWNTGPFATLDEAREAVDSVAETAVR